MKKLILIATIVVGLFADIGKVAVVKGEATINRSDKSVEAYNNIGLLKHDIVQTKQGRLQMLFIDNTVISLGRESRFVIEEYLYVKDSKKVAATFKVEKGFIKTITGSIGKVMPTLFVLHTPSSKITPNGTIWSVKVNNGREEYRVLEGEITLDFQTNKEQQTLVLKAGEALVLNTTQVGNKQVVKKQRKSKIESKQEKNIEQKIANSIEKQDMNKGTIVRDDGTIVDENPNGDGNNGHGNDPGGFDPSNPGKGHSKPKKK